MSNKNSPLTNLSGCIFIVPSPDKFVTKDSNHGPGPSGSTDVNSVNQISAGMRRVQAVKNRKLRVPPITYSNESETATTYDQRFIWVILGPPAGFYHSIG